MEVISAQEKDHLDALLERIKADELAQEQMEKLSQESFEEWLFETFVLVAQKLGYSMRKIKEFLKTLGHAFQKGMEVGRKRAQLQGEVWRSKIDRWCQ